MKHSARARAAGSDLEQAVLRIRLAATALAATLLVLVPAIERLPAGSLLLGYAAIALALRAAGAGIRGSAVIGLAMDVLFPTALLLLMPLSAVWVLYLVPIGIAAMRSGIAGVAVTVAACLVASDVALVARGDAALAADLWRTQAILAFGVLAAELVHVSVRSWKERSELRLYSLAQRDLAVADGTDAILDRIADHAVRSFGATAAWVEHADVPSSRTEHARGAPGPDDRPEERFALAPDITLHVSFAGDAPPHGAAAIRDLVVDTRALLAAAGHREREAQERAAEGHLLTALAHLGRETSRAGVLAETLTTAQQIAGASAIVRLADGERLAGDLDPEVATAIARDGVLPRLVRTGDAATAIAVGAGHGHALVSSGTRRALTNADVRVLARLGAAAATAGERLEEREALLANSAALHAKSEDLGRRLRERDEAVAAAVHEIRNPLTSVQAYGQLMSRHLSTVQQQVGQLDTLIEDLLRSGEGSPRRPLVLEPTDLAREAGFAVSRLRVAVPGTEIRLTTEKDASLEAPLDAGRFAQVLDNVLRNAAKYSPPGTPIRVRVSRGDDEVRITVSDAGDGIDPAELDRIFDRYTRGTRHTETTGGAGIGLAVSREIVAAHGGRIWAESAGRGRGSTFIIALPTAARTSPLPA